MNWTFLNTLTLNDIMKRRKHYAGHEYTTKEGNHINTLSGTFLRGTPKPSPVLFLGNSHLQIPRNEAAKILKLERTRR